MEVAAGAGDKLGKRVNRGRDHLVNSRFRTHLCPFSREKKSGKVVLVLARIDLVDLAEVRRQALRLSGELLRELGSAFWEHPEWVRLVDAKGQARLGRPIGNSPLPWREFF
jgi:hypothetical protein